MRGRRADETEEVMKGTLPGDVSMLRRVLETMAAFLSTTNSKPSALMSLTTPAVSSSSSSWGWWCSRGGGILRPATDWIGIEVGVGSSVDLLSQVAD